MRLVASCLILSLCAASLTAAEPATTSSTPQAEKKTPALHQHPTLLKMLSQNNALRVQMGLAPHRIDPELTKAAQYHANYMARTGQFSHYANGSPDSRAYKFGYGGGVRENIAWGQFSVRQVFGDWRNSGGHWASIISHTRDAGFGYAVGSNGRGYWVGMYGNNSRIEVAKPVVETTSSQ